MGACKRCIGAEPGAADVLGCAAALGTALSVPSDAANGGGHQVLVDELAHLLPLAAVDTGGGPSASWWRLHAAAVLARLGRRAPAPCRPSEYADVRAPLLQPSEPE